MSKVVADVLMSLDRFTAGPNVRAAEPRETGWTPARVDGRETSQHWDSHRRFSDNERADPTKLNQQKLSNDVLDNTPLSHHYETPDHRRRTSHVTRPRPQLLHLTRRLRHR